MRIGVLYHTFVFFLFILYYGQRQQTEDLLIFALFSNVKVVI